MKTEQRIYSETDGWVIRSDNRLGLLAQLVFLFGNRELLKEQKYIEFVEKLTKDNEISLKEAVKKGEQRRNEKEVAEAKKRESEVQKFKDMIESYKKFAEDYIKSKNNIPVSLEIINRIGRVAMHTNDRDMIEWVLKNRII